MLEPEVAFADLNAIADLAVSYLRYVSKQVLSECRDDLLFLQQHYEDLSLEAIEQMSNLQCERITYTDAINLLQEAAKSTKRAFEFSPQWGNDLQTEHERYLTEEVFAGAVIVTDYPKSFKPFYMRANDDGKTVACMDLLLPKVGELIGGSEREERYEVLKSNCDMQWYLDLRRFGAAPTAGWGMGFDRLVQYFTGMRNIRDTVLSPRAPDLIPF